MNAIRLLPRFHYHIDKLIEARRQQQIHEERLRKISESYLPGIAALPVELWGVIIEDVVEQDVATKHYTQQQALYRSLSLRLVCGRKYCLGPPIYYVLTNMSRDFQQRDTDCAAQARHPLQHALSIIHKRFHPTP